MSNTNQKVNDDQNTDPVAPAEDAGDINVAEPTETVVPAEAGTQDLDSGSVKSGMTAAEDAQIEPEVSETETELEEAGVVIPEPEVEAPTEEAVVEEATSEEVTASTEAPISSDLSDLSDPTDSLAEDQATFEDKPESPAETVAPTDNTDSTALAGASLTEATDVPISSDVSDLSEATDPDQPNLDPDNKGKWYVVHTYSGHENRVATAIKQRIESEHLEHKIFDILVPTQDKIEIRGGKKEQVKEKIFPGYILVKIDLDDASWMAVRTTQGVTSFVGIGNKPTPISESEVRGIVKFMSQGATSTFKDIFSIDDTVKIIDGPFADFIGKVDAVDKEKGKVRVLVSIFGRETPVELDFLQVQKL